MSEENDFEDFAPWLVFLLTLTGVGLRVLLLDTKGMWLDETFSVWLANQSVPDMLHWIVRIDQHPPLYPGRKIPHFTAILFVTGSLLFLPKSETHT